MECTLKVRLSPYQAAKLIDYRDKHNAVLGVNATCDHIMESMLFIGFAPWFDDRLKAMDIGLNIMRDRFGYADKECEACHSPLQN